MNCYKTSACTLLFYLLFSLPLPGQHQASFTPPVPALTAPDHELKHSRLSMLMYHNYLNVQTPEGPHLLIIPALGLDYEYWFSHHWGLGLHNDLVMTHRIENSLLSGRSFPFLTTIDGLWKPYKGLVFLLGPGLEFEDDEHILFFRGGIEYEIELGAHWDVCPTIFYDNRRSAYNTCSVGLGIGKKF